MLKKYDAFLVGYYGMQNVGDDALMLAAMTGTKRFLGCRSVLVTTASDQPELLTKKEQNYVAPEHWLKGSTRLNNYLQAFKSRRVVFGGGSVLHSAKDLKQKLHLLQLSNAEYSMAVGVGIEPFRSKSDEQACARFLRECGFVGLRDQQSYEIAKSLAPGANLKKTFDLAPLLQIHPKYRLYQGSRKGIAVNICPAPVNAFGEVDDKQEEKRILRLSHFIREIHQKTGEPIHLVNLNGHFQFGDWKLVNKLRGKLGDSVPVVNIPYCSNPLKVIYQLSSYKLVVSMRLHGNILAFLSETPSISLGYHSKCRQWCQQIGLPQEYFFNANDFSILKLVETASQGLEKGFVPNRLSTQDALKQTLLNWSHRYEHAKNISGYTPLQQS